MHQRSPKMETLPRGAHISGSPKPPKRKFEVFDLIGRCPKYSRPIDNATISKMAQDYHNWREKLEAMETEQAISQFENRNNRNVSPTDTTQSPAKPDFDPSFAKILIDSTKHKKPNTEQISHLSTPKPLVHKRPFRLTPKTSFGIPIYDKITAIRNEEYTASAAKRIIMLDALDLKKKQETTRTLAKAAREKREREREDKLQLGLTCQQGWALAKVKAKEDAEYRALHPPPEPLRPITAETKEAMSQLDEFDRRMREERKKKLAEDQQKQDDDLQKLCQADEHQ